MEEQIIPPLDAFHKYSPRMNFVGTPGSNVNRIINESPEPLSINVITAFAWYPSRVPTSEFNTSGNGVLPASVMRVTSASFLGAQAIKKRSSKK